MLEPVRPCRVTGLARCVVVLGLGYEDGMYSFSPFHSWPIGREARSGVPDALEDLDSLSTGPGGRVGALVFVIWILACRYELPLAE